MSSAVSTRGRVEVITELYELTKEMERRKDDADFLIASVEKRQGLMDEYDLLRQNTDDPGEEAKAEMGRMVKEVIGMDTAITAALEGHKKASKADLTASNRQQKVLGYVNQALSSSGSYMDYKK